MAVTAVNTMPLTVSVSLLTTETHVAVTVAVRLFATAAWAEFTTFGALPAPSSNAVSVTTLVATAAATTAGVFGLLIVLRRRFSNELIAAASAAAFALLLPAVRLTW